ncbi:adhesion G-protein coupled receptor G6-like [Amphiura filiformis]|uniref:adhesion G-protein coupled receptor G6-like n=1 Tax=Amphiura filiformis TaxID=82378 RepID=UPI003B20BB3F
MTNKTVSGDIIAPIVIGTNNVHNLAEPVALEFTVTGENPTCVFWDFNILDWSQKGCEFVASVRNKVMCHCYHLTNFAVLVDVTYEKSHVVLDVVSKLGCGLSMCSLLITLIIFISFRQLRSGNNAISRKILIQFCMALFLLYFVFLVGIDRVSHRGGCIFVAALLHFLTLVSLSWMGVEAYHMYLNVVKVFDAIPEHFLLKASLVAWGFPLLVSVISLGAGMSYYGHMQYCFVATGPPLYYGLVLPIATILLHNTITFGLVMRRLFKANLGGTVQQKSKAAQISRRLQNAFAISILMGLTWVFGFFAIDGAKFIFSLIFCLFNSFQGVVVFVLFCVRQEDVKKSLYQFIGSIFHLSERATSMTASTGVISATSGPTYDDRGFNLASMSSPSTTENLTYSIPDFKEGKCSHCEEESQATVRVHGEAEVYENVSSRCQNNPYNEAEIGPAAEGKVTAEKMSQVVAAPDVAIGYDQPTSNPSLTSPQMDSSEIMAVAIEIHVDSEKSEIRSTPTAK